MTGEVRARARDCFLADPADPAETLALQAWNPVPGCLCACVSIALSIAQRAQACRGAARRCEPMRRAVAGGRCDGLDKK